LFVHFPAIDAESHVAHIKIHVTVVAAVVNMIFRYWILCFSGFYGKVRSIFRVQSADAWREATSGPPNWGTRCIDNV